MDNKEAKSDKIVQSFPDFCQFLPKGNVAKEHGIDEEKMQVIRGMLEKVDAADIDKIAEIAKKACVPESVVEKIAEGLKK